MTRTSINLYLHTHWDREWYLPYETYRAQLVEVARQIIAKLRNGELPNFLLDGQSCALEDIFEIEPALAQPIRELMAEEKLSAGPWYVLADQMLVSGESLVRNLKIGLDCTRQYGEPALVGYCPDTFGHTEDMPRILRGFGIDNAIVWRGVPELEGPPVFLWNSQDGSSVLAHLLEFGYYQTAFHDSKTAAELLAHLQRFVQKESHYPLIVPVGADHMGPPPVFSQQLDALKKELAGTAPSVSKSATASATAISLEITTDPITKFSSDCRGLSGNGLAKLHTIAAELRENASAQAHERAYMLPGVLSTRLYLKRENRYAEHRLVRIAEPLFSVLAAKTGMTYPGPELLYAWKLLLRNQPHDSICGCSVDEVHKEMMHRYAKFHHAVNALDARAVEWICGQGQTQAPRVSISRKIVTSPEYKIDRIAVFNMSTEPVSCPVRVTWAELPDEFEAGLGETSPATVQLISKDREPLIFSGTGREPDVRKVHLNQAYVWAENVPPMGMRQVKFLEEPESPSKQSRSGKLSASAVQVESRRLSNGLLSVEINKSGELIVTEHSKNGNITYRLRHSFRDTADGGDTYNYDPLMEDEPITAQLTDVKPWLRGPLVGSLQLSYDLDIPASVVEAGGSAPQELKYFSRSPRTNSHNITTEISLRRGVPIVFFDTRWVNKSTDHRLEVVFDTGEVVDETYSENHFSTIERKHKKIKTKLPVEKCTEAPLDRFPCQRFFIANGQLFLNKGLPEYGVDGSTVSLTVLRAVSRLSRPRLMTRGGGAGPAVATPEANCLGMNEVTYGWAPLAQPDLSDQLPDSYRMAELFEGSAFTVPLDSKALDDSFSLFTVDNRAIRIAALYTRGERMFIRLLNVSKDQQKARLSLNLLDPRVVICNLDEEDLEAIPASSSAQDASSFALQFGPNQLLTLSVMAPGR